jgi:hypothetical protein
MLESIQCVLKGACSPWSRRRSSRSLFKFQISSVALALTLALDSSTIAQAAPHFGVLRTQDFEVYHAITSDAEFVEFRDRTLPAMTAYVRFWEKRGFRLPVYPLRVYLAPSAELTARQAFPTMTGPNFQTDLAQLLSTVEKASSTEQVEQAVRAFACAYPTFLGSHRRFASTFFREFTDGLLLEESKSIVLQIPTQLEEYLKDLTTESWNFWQSVSQIDFMVSRDARCSAIRLGRGGLAARSQEPLPSVDIVFHELAHALHFGTWQQSPGVFSKIWSATIIESIADVFALTYLNDPCHGPRLDPATGKRVCSRVIDTFDQSLSENLWKSSSRYEQGQALKAFYWDLRQEVGLEQTADALATPLLQLVTQMSDADPEILKKAHPSNYRYTRALDPFSSFFTMVSETLKQGFFIVDSSCRLSSLSTSQTCKNAAKYLGEPLTNDLEAIRRTSPRTIGKAGITVELDGKPVHLRFTSAQGRETIAEISDGSRTQSYRFVPRSDEVITDESVSPRRRIFRMQLQSDAGDTVFWSSLGTLTR